MLRKLKEGAKRKSFFLLHIIFGIFLMIFSVLVVLSKLEFVESSIFFSSSFIELLLIILGVVVIVDAIKHRHLSERTVGLIIGIVILLFGTLPLFHTMGMLKFLPVILFLNVNSIVLAILLFVSAFYFIVDKFMLWFS